MSVLLLVVTGLSLYTPNTLVDCGDKYENTSTKIVC